MLILSDMFDIRNQSLPTHIGRKKLQKSHYLWIKSTCLYLRQPSPGKSKKVHSAGMPMWLEKEEFFKKLPKAASSPLDSRILSPLWVSVTNASGSLMVLPSSPNTNIQQYHRKSCRGPLQSTGLQLSRGKEPPFSEAAAPSLSQDLGSKQTLSLWIWDLSTLSSKWQGDDNH